MLTLREDQFRALALVPRQVFEERIASHLKKFFPFRISAMDLHELGGFVRHGCDRAAVHGFKSGREICKYIDLMMVFGRDFDTDGRYPWAAEILERTDLDRIAKIDAIVRAGLDSARPSEITPKNGDAP